MSITRLGWDILEPNSKRLVSFKWITGKVRAGDAATILDYLCERFNSEVEKITVGHSWGYAKRDVRGASVASEHSAGVAIDLNAPKHPLGASGTFSKAQRSAIHKILADLDGAVRWGGDYAGRKDEMHFELQGGVKKLAQVAEKISDKPKPKPADKPKPDTKPKPSKGKGWPAEPLPVTSKHTAESDKAWRELMAAVGYKDSNLTTNIERWLKDLGYYKGIIEKDHGKAPVFGRMLVEALQRFLASKKLYSGRIDGNRQSMTIRAEISYLNLPANRGL